MKSLEKKYMGIFDIGHLTSDGHCNLETESANLVKILLNLSIFYIITHGMFNEALSSNGKYIQFEEEEKSFSKSVTNWALFQSSINQIHSFFLFFLIKYIYFIQNHM